jgi:hypothetical protein
VGVGRSGLSTSVHVSVDGPVHCLALAQDNVYESCCCDVEVSDRRVCGGSGCEAVVLDGELYMC